MYPEAGSGNLLKKEGVGQPSEIFREEIPVATQQVISVRLRIKQV